MNNKSKIIVGILIATLVLLGGYKMFFSPEGVEGEKEVSIHVVIEKEDIDETFTYNTEHEFLLELLEENEKELGATLETSETGTMVIGMMDYEANLGEQEFFLIQINGEDALTGVGEISIVDEDVYRFELSNY